MTRINCQTGSPIGGSGRRYCAVSSLTADILTVGFLFSIILPFAPAVAALAGLKEALSAVFLKIDSSV
ncbi:MAG: hypothetical protein WC831_01340 [Parcubacteria group bacterium]|jgi:hypothetical protein